MGAEIGMLVVETIAKIRRAYFVHGQPIKAICRDLGVSRKVVRKTPPPKAPPAYTLSGSAGSAATALILPIT